MARSESCSPSRSVTVAVLQAGTKHSENGNPGLEANFQLFSGLAREASVAGTRLPDDQYRIEFLAPADLALLGSQTHVSAGLRTETQIELPPFTDDLLIKIERIQVGERTLIPGTQ